MMACSVNGKRKEGGGSPTDEVCAQKAGWQWGDGVSKMHGSLRLPYPPAQPRLLTCCWVIGGRRHHLPLPTRSTGLWRPCRFCGKNGTVSYWDCSLSTVDLLRVSEVRYLLFTLPVSFTPAKGKLYHTGGECNIQRAAGFVQLHAHDPLVLHSVVTAPGGTRQDGAAQSLSGVCSLSPDMPSHPASQPTGWCLSLVSLKVKQIL